MNQANYKGISILQPWASLCVHTDSNGKALKQIETRSWNTKHRGRLLIHASKKAPSYLNSGFELWQEIEKLGLCKTTQVPKWVDYKGEDFPLGAIIGCVDLEAVLRTDNIDSSADEYQQSMLLNADRSKFEGNIATISPQEYAFGDYSPNRFGWLLSNPILFREPIPCKGQLSIWNLPAELEPSVNRQIELAA